MSTKSQISSRLIFVGLIFLITQNQQQILAQRPSYAGPRPTGGFSQKDKYHTPQNTIQNPAGGVNSRFDGTDQSNKSVLSNSVPYGATQRPPVGWPVVMPQAQYVPLLNNNNQQQFKPNQQNAVSQQQPQLTLDNRIGSNDIGNNLSSQTQPQSPPVTGFQSLPPPSPINALPLDAHGDQALIDYLNTVPLDQRPFWFLNYQAIEAQRNSTNPKFTGAVGGRGSFFG